MSKIPTITRSVEIRTRANFYLLNFPKFIFILFSDSPENVGISSANVNFH